MVNFKSQLAGKVLATYKAGRENPDHSTFLRNFGKFHVANLNQDVVPADKLAVEMLTEIQSELARLRRTLPRELERSQSKGGETEVILRAVSQYLVDNPGADLAKLVDKPSFVKKIENLCDAPNHFSTRGAFTDVLEKVIKDIVTRSLLM